MERSGVEMRRDEILQPGSVETLAQEGTWLYFLVDKPLSSWKPREIKEDVLLLNQQPWQNYPPWIGTYPHLRYYTDVTCLQGTTIPH